MDRESARGSRRLPRLARLRLRAGGRRQTRRCAPALAEGPRPDLVLLDLRLPGEDGLSLARWLRDNHEVAIIMVTGRPATWVDRVVGLEVGADDYLGKPFDLARGCWRGVQKACCAAGRQAGKKKPRQGGSDPGACRSAPASSTLDTHQLIGQKGREGGIPLTGMEFDLLRVFSEHPNPRAVARQLPHADPQPRVGAVRPLDRHPQSARLRRKIELDPEKAGAPSRRLRWGRDYIFITVTGFVSVPVIPRWENR